MKSRKRVLLLQDENVKPSLCHNFFYHRCEQKSWYDSSNVFKFLSNLYSSPEKIKPKYKCVMEIEFFDAAKDTCKRKSHAVKIIEAAEYEVLMIMKRNFEKIYIIHFVSNLW